MIAAICRIRIVGRPKRNLARLPFVNADAVQEERDEIDCREVNQKVK